MTQLLPPRSRLLLEELKRRGLNLGTSLWPAPYNQLSWEAGYRFLTECWWTDNEANQRVERIPAKDYIEWFVQDWVGCFQRRQPVVYEKSRRLVISWAARGLETWVMGLQRGAWLIIDQTHKNAGEHLWRVDFALNQLRDRRPEFQLKKHRPYGAILKKEPTHVLLPNGSVMMQSHQDAGAAQGKGMTGVTLEEISKYKNPAAFWGQALIVSMGAPGEPGGWVCGIANPSINDAWRDIKGKESPRQLLGLD